MQLKCHPLPDTARNREFVEYADEQRRSYACMIAAMLSPKQAVGFLESFEPHVPWSRVFLQLRQRQYAAVSHPLAAQAALDLAEFTQRATVAATCTATTMYQPHFFLSSSPIEPASRTMLPTVWIRFRNAVCRISVLSIAMLDRSTREPSWPSIAPGSEIGARAMPTRPMIIVSAD